jgi:hypothetical protein
VPPSPASNEDLDAGIALIASATACAASVTAVSDAPDGNDSSTGVPDRTALAIFRSATLSAWTSSPDGEWPAADWPAAVTAVAVTVLSSRSSAAMAGCQAMARCLVHCGSVIACWNSSCRLASWIRACECGAVPRAPLPTAWSR